VNTQHDFLILLQRYNKSNCCPVPSREDARHFTEDMIGLLFPVYAGQDFSVERAELKLMQLRLQLQELIVPLSKELSHTYTWYIDSFFEKLPDIYARLLKDADAILKFDPAAYSLEEIIVAYPGFYAIMVYRIAHELYRLNIPILPRIISEFAHSSTGIDIHPGAQIGESFFIDHGTGVVIGETCTIGNHVKIYQGVTLGALIVEKALARTKRHPTIEDHVIIYSGSTILGGETTVGHHTVIGGNVWLTESAAPHSVVYHKSEIKVRNHVTYTEPINFII
jgi:serine O-acetyltransferase